MAGPAVLRVVSTETFRPYAANDVPVTCACGVIPFGLLNISVAVAALACVGVRTTHDAERTDNDEHRYAHDGTPRRALSLRVMLVVHGWVP